MGQGDHKDAQYKVLPNLDCYFGSFGHRFGSCWVTVLLLFGTVNDILCNCVSFRHSFRRPAIHGPGKGIRITRPFPFHNPHPSAIRPVPRPFVPSLVPSSHNQRRASFNYDWRDSRCDYNLTKSKLFRNTYTARHLTNIKHGGGISAAALLDTFDLGERHGCDRLAYIRVQPFSRRGH